MHAKETKSRTYMQWSAEPAEASMERKDQQQKVGERFGEQ